VFQGGFLWRFPEVALQVHARLNDFDAFAFEEFSLEGSVRLTDENFAAFAEDAMPGNAFAGRSGGHGASRAARATGETQGFRQRPISKNPAAWNLFHEAKYRIPRHFKLSSKKTPRRHGKKLVTNPRWPSAREQEENGAAGFDEVAG